MTVEKRPVPPSPPPSSRAIVVLGSTGSIGTQTLEVVRAHPERLRITGLAAGANGELLLEQAREFRPESVHLADPDQARALAPAFKALGCRVVEGPDGLLEMAALCPADLVVAATVGWTGVEPTLAALQAGRDVALANKEVLVCAGDLVMAASRRTGAKIWPLDSEHNAVMQCLAAGPPGAKAPLRRIVLTCSGGPFRNASREEIDAAPPARTLDHPTWAMGRKITVDSATLMNKGFEVIEAHHLFRCPLDLIEVVVHPQSIVHSIVEFVDGSMIAQMGATDMRLPIQNVLTHPWRVPTPVPPLDLAALGRLDFSAPDHERFPCLRMAYDAAREGGTVPCILNAANEVAVEAHLNGLVPCGAIPRIVASVLEAQSRVDRADLEVLKAADSEARKRARKAIETTAASKV